MGSHHQHQPNDPPIPGDAPIPDDTPDDAWKARFYLSCFLRLMAADDHTERREVVWLKGFFNHYPGHPFVHELDQIVARSTPEHVRVADDLLPRAARELSEGDKRRFVYNMAQMCKSKGAIGEEEYATILDFAQGLGMEDTDADHIINSVFSINDTFTAIMGLLALGVILYTTQSVIVPLVIAAFITMIIGRVESLVTRLVDLQSVRWLSKVVAMVVILGVLFGLILAATSSGKEMAARWPYYQSKLTLAAEQAEAKLRKYGIPLPKNIDVLQQLNKLPVGKTVGDLFSSLFTLVGNFFLVVVFVGFLVFSGLPDRGMMREMNERVSGYITIKSLMSLATGLGMFLLCLAFGVDFPLFWATLGFLLNFVPSVGSIIASIPPVLLAMVQLESWAAIAFFALSLAGFHMLLGNVIEPKLMGDKLAIKPLAILMGLIFWGFLWGLPGMFLAAPLMALLRILSSYFNFSRNIERMLAADL